MEVSKETEEPSVEDIKRLPVWLARFLNLIIRWTHTYCSGGCGYPVTGQYEVEIDKLDDIPVVMLVCSLNSECARRAAEDPFDEQGNSYADVRPLIRNMPRDTDRYRLSLTR